MHRKYRRSHTIEVWVCRQTSVELRPIGNYVVSAISCEVRNYFRNSYNIIKAGIGKNKWATVRELIEDHRCQSL